MFHLESARVTCSICSKIFSSISNLRKHQKKHTRRSIASTVAAEKLPLFQCSECPKAFKYEKYLEVCREFCEISRLRLCAHGVVFLKVLYCSPSSRDQKTNENATKTTPCAHSLRPRAHGNVFLRFCIVSSNELVVLDSLENSKQYENAGKRFRVYGA